MSKYFIAQIWLSLKTNAVCVWRMKRLKHVQLYSINLRRFQIPQIHLYLSPLVPSIPAPVLGLHRSRDDVLLVTLLSNTYTRHGSTNKNGSSTWSH